MNDVDLHFLFINKCLTKLALFLLFQGIGTVATLAKLLPWESCLPQVHLCL